MTPLCSQAVAPITSVGGRSSRRFAVSLPLICLALLGLIQTGCQSSGCNSCGLGSRLTSGVQSLNARLFSGHRDRGGCSTCGTLGTVQEGTIVESGVPITPGAIAIPPPGTIVTPPPVESEPAQLAPLSSGTANPTSAKGSQAGTNRSAYEASTGRNSAIASKRGSDLSRAYHAPSSPAPVGLASDEPDVFDNLPPVDLPADLSRRATPMGKGSDPSPPAIIAPADPATKTSSTELDSAGDALVLPSAPPANSPTRSAPGIVRSASVAPLLAGGSLPSADGLAWLKEKGYRTFVDLRPRAAVDPTFPDQVSDSGMLYVAIPFVVDPINPTRLARFNDLIAQSDQRPLYFCDADGRRAGLIWYLRLRAVDHEDPASARLKADELGLLAADVDVAEQFLKLNITMDTLPITPIAVQPSEAIDPPVALTAPVAVAAAATPHAVTAFEQEPAPTFPERKKSAPSFDPLGKGTSWKPAAALVLSGLGVPLAYWSGSNLLQKRAPRRASLTARKPGPRKALPSSDV